MVKFCVHISPIFSCRVTFKCGYNTKMDLCLSQICILLLGCYKAQNVTEPAKQALYLSANPNTHI